MPSDTGANAAAVRLRELIAAGTHEVEPAELMKLADIAASRVADRARREKLAEQLIEAMAVLRFAPVFGHDPEIGRGRANALLDEIAAL
jgi:hypothetical protein